MLIVTQNLYPLIQQKRNPHSCARWWQKCAIKIAPTVRTFNSEISPANLRLTNMGNSKSAEAKAAKGRAILSVSLLVSSRAKKF